MIEPRTLDQILAADALASFQAAIVATLRTLNPGVTIEPHPGKVDLSELVSKTVVKAPGLSVGWSRIKTGQHAEGHFYLAVEWVVYVVAEARIIGGRRVEKEAVGIALGGRVLEILADMEHSLWGLTRILPPETTPPAELKPLFTIRDQAQGIAYYTVTWTQIMADRGSSVFPDPAGHWNEQDRRIDYADASSIDELAPWIPALREPDDA
ncbi:phage protein Gp37 [Gellertiella hungarica]|uniref:Putative RmlC-like cupin family protein n=1 Tax=Gellertiella hungarica TaxID=1572859 RepID=A0A7W6J9C9_9HYPH|nr:hypothetical protein [Gellertiella hungarica]MBB4066273.1 putative RmlC-like cupin family protein [Gellertiella hungarica]